MGDALTRRPDTPLDAQEAALLAQVAAGHRHAFDALFRAYHPRLLRFLDRMARNPALAEEIVNDTLLVVWQKAGTYDGSCKVSTWVFAIAWRKAMKALKMADAPMESDSNAYADDEAVTPERHAELHQLATRLAAAVDLLPWQQKMVVVLTYFHGLGYAEIAAVAGCPVNTVKTRMFHARRRLQLLLADEKEDFA